MRRILALLLLLCIMLCGCSGDNNTDDKTEEAIISEKEENNNANDLESKENLNAVNQNNQIDEINNEEVLRHPLTGEIVDTPWTISAKAITINNAIDALPQYGISKADIMYEIETEGGVTRYFAIFTDVETVDSIGPVRSTRTYLNNIAAAYDAPIFHCSGNSLSRNGHYDMNGNIISDWKHIDETTNSQYFFRDSDRYNYQGYAWEHTLFATGEGMTTAVVDKGYHDDSEVDYGLSFAEKPVLNGQAATNIVVTFYGGKTTTMIYNVDTGLYEAEQYGDFHIDAGVGEVMQYRNVFVLYATQYQDMLGEYLLSFYDLVGSGSGHFACDGEIVPINWSRASVYDPFVYTLEDGTPLTLGVGNSYIGIVSDTRTVEYN